MDIFVIVGFGVACTAAVIIMQMHSMHEYRKELDELRASFMHQLNGIQLIVNQYDKTARFNRSCAPGIRKAEKRPGHVVVSTAEQEYDHGKTYWKEIGIGDSPSVVPMRPKLADIKAWWLDLPGFGQ